MITLYCFTNVPPFLQREWARDLRGLWAAEELGLTYGIQLIDAAQSEQKGEAFRCINPFGKLPALADGDFTLFESGAMVTYLAEKAGRLIPLAKMKERALYDQWCFAALNTVEPAIFELLLASTIGKDAPGARERASQLREQSATRLAALDAHVKTHRFLLGETLSGADILMGHVLNFVVDASLFDDVAAVRAYHSRLKARPAYERALAALIGGKNAAVAAQ
jgi:glutathione S-transferase